MYIKKYLELVSFVSISFGLIITSSFYDETDKYKNNNTFISNPSTLPLPTITSTTTATTSTITSSTTTSIILSTLLPITTTTIKPNITTTSNNNNTITPPVINRLEYIIYGVNALDLYYTNKSETLKYTINLEVNSMIQHKENIYSNIANSKQIIYNTKYNNIDELTDRTNLAYTNWGICFDGLMIFFNKGDPDSIYHSDDYGKTTTKTDIFYLPMNNIIVKDFLVDYATCKIFIATNFGLYVSINKGYIFLQYSTYSTIKLYNIDSIIFNVFEADSIHGFGMYYDDEKNIGNIMKFNGYKDLNYIACTPDNIEKILYCLTTSDKNKKEYIVPIIIFDDINKNYTKYDISNNSTIINTYKYIAKVRQKEDKIILYNTGQQNNFVIRDGREPPNITIINNSKKYNGIFIL